MEIDFMGLYSKIPPEQNGYVPDAFVDSGIGSIGESNVSLSLCTSSPTDENTVFQDFLRKKIRKSPAENMTSIRNSSGKYDWEKVQLGERSCPSFTGKPIISHSGFPYNRNDGSMISRNTFERTLSFPASSNVFCPIAAPNMFPAQKADRKMYATGDASFDDTRKSKHGYTPTVAMARKATLARFLEKRSHRMQWSLPFRIPLQPFDRLRRINSFIEPTNKTPSNGKAIELGYYLYKTQQEDEKQHAA